MSKITYTFPIDFKVAELRGVTCTGGEFWATTGKYSDPIDAVRFIDEIKVGGVLRRIAATIAGKPELEKAWADHKAKEAAQEAVLSSIGWHQYQAAQSRAINARYAYDAASDRGYPVKEAAAMRTADEALDAASVQYPLAAAYAKAESYSMASHDQKASAGRRAMEAIKSGADPLQTIENMDAQWSAAAEKCVNNS